MEPRDGDGESRFDDAFDWEDETVETQHRAATPPDQPPEHGPVHHRTLRSDLERLRHRVSPPVLLGAGALLIAVIVIVAVLATRGGDDTEAASPSEPASPPAAVDPEATPPADEPVSPQPPAASPSLTLSEDVTLQEGDEGADVTELQQALVQLGFSTGEPDGIFGEQTRLAVEAFQESAGLEVDGVAGPGTAAAINDALAGRG